MSADLCAVLVLPCLFSTALIIIWLLDNVFAPIPEMTAQEADESIRAELQYHHKTAIEVIHKYNALLEALSEEEAEIVVPSYGASIWLSQNGRYDEYLSDRLKRALARGVKYGQ